MTLALALRDIHQPPAPPFWPPAPGWWALFALLLAGGLAAWWWHARRRRRQRAVEAVFDSAVGSADTPSQAVAAMSEALRRAARRHDPRADRMSGDAWLALLAARLPPDEAAALDPSRDAGALLLEGGVRDDVADAEAEALRPLARKAYLALVHGGKRRP